MADTPSKQQGYPGQQTPFDNNTTSQTNQFMVEQVLGRVNTVMLAQVKKVTNKGEVKEVGQVDVQPLAKMMDGAGNTFSHGVINDLPYFRLQGGSDKAVILDPKVGDIGVAVFADRDISGVKRSKKESPPGSFRRFDMADGLFFPCFLGGKPTTYVRFTDDNKIYLVDPNKSCVVVTKDCVQLKKKGSPTLHVTVDIANSKIILGSDPVIEPDPYPNEPEGA